ncbi:MAG: hypothetical protein AABX08_04590 [Nanoarchaeota archaeon]
MKCLKCTYVWESRVKEPKACPRCKTRLDFTPKDIKIMNNYKEVER